MKWPSPIHFQHQNMSKTRHQNVTKKKNNNTSSQKLLDHCYTFGFVAVAFQLWRSSPLEKGPHKPIIALPWIHHCAELAQQSIQMCGSHEYSQMLVDNCYAFSLLLQHSTLKEKFFGEGAPHWRIMALLWICPWRIWPKSEYKWAGSWVLYPYKVLWISIKWFCS